MISFALVQRKYTDAMMESRIKNIRIIDAENKKMKEPIATMGGMMTGMEFVAMTGASKDVQLHLAGLNKELQTGAILTRNVGGQMITLASASTTAAASAGILVDAYGKKIPLALTGTAAAAQTAGTAKGTLKGKAVLVGAFMKKHWVGWLLMAVTTLTYYLIPALFRTKDGMREISVEATRGVEDFAEYAKSMRSLSTYLARSLIAMESLSSSLASVGANTTEYQSKLYLLGRTVDQISTSLHNVPSFFSEEDLQNIEKMNELKRETLQYLKEQIILTEEAGRIAQHALVAQTRDAHNYLDTYKKISPAIAKAMELLSRSPTKFLDTKAQEEALSFIDRQIDEIKSNWSTFQTQSPHLISESAVRQHIQELNSLIEMRERLSKSTLDEAETAELMAIKVEGIYRDLFTKIVTMSEQIPGLPKRLGLEEDNIEEVRKRFKDLGKALQEEMKLAEDQGKGLETISWVAVLERAGLNAVPELALLLGEIAGEHMQKMNRAFEIWNENINNSRVSIGLTAKEMQKLYRQVAIQVSEAIVAHKKLGSSIQKDVGDRLREASGTDYYQTAYEHVSKLKRQYEEILDAAEKRLVQEKATQDILKEQAQGLEKEHIDQAMAAREQMQSLQESLGLTGSIRQQWDQIQALQAEGLETANINDYIKAMSEYQFHMRLASAGFSLSLEEITARFDEIAASMGLTADQAALVRSELESQARSAAEGVEQLEKAVDLTKKMYGGAVANLKVEERKLHLLRLQGRIESELFQHRIKGGRGGFEAIGEMIRALELGNESIYKEQERQVAILDLQTDLYSEIYTQLIGAKETRAEALDLATKLYNGEISHLDIIRRINDLNWEDVDARKDLVTYIQLAVNRHALLVGQTNESYELQKKTLGIISRMSVELSKAADQTERIFEFKKRMVEITGTVIDAHDLEIENIKRQIALEKSRVKIMKDNLSDLASSVKYAEEYARLTNEIRAGAEKLALLRSELEYAELEETFANIEPLLKSMAESAGNISDAFGNLFRNLVTNTRGYYENIAELTAEKEVSEEYVNRLLAQRNTILDESSDAYKAIFEEIERSQKDLQNINEELEEAKNLGDMLRSTFADFADSLGEIFLEIHTEQLKTALTGLLTQTGIGRVITDAFSTGAQIAGRDFSTQVKKDLDKRQKLVDTALAEATKSLSDELKRALEDGSTNGAQNLYDAIVNGLEDGMAKVRGVEEGIKGPSSGPVFYHEGIDVTAERMNRNEAANTEGMYQESSEANDTLGQIEKNTNETSPTLGPGFSNMQAAIESSAVLLGSMFGTHLAASVHGPHAGRAGGIGASMGSTFASQLVPDVASKVLGAALGTVIPVVGGLLGGLIGGLFASKPKPKKREDYVVEDNTTATRSNTEAIRSLNSEFQDLRNELINAPSRFSLAPGATLGGYLGGSMGSPDSGPSGGSQGLSININVQGDLNQGAADKIISEVSKVYDMQRRTGGINSRKLRR